MGEFALDQIVVTATRTEKKIIDVPASVFVVTAKDIENSGAVTPDDIFKKVYRKYELEYARKSYSKNHSILSIESFFNSDFFHCITNFKVDPLYIINEVRKEMNIPVLP